MTVPDPADDEDAAQELVAPPLRISQTMVWEIIDHLRSALPNEGCGLIAALQTSELEIVAVRFFPGTNTDHSPVRFTMDAGEVVGAFKKMRALDQELGAIVHSHPVSEAEPSATDFQEAFYPDALMLIVTFARELPDLRAWRIIQEDGNQRAVECQIVYE